MSLFGSIVNSALGEASGEFKDTSEKGSAQSFAELLSKEHREHLQKIAELLSLSGKPLYWDGKAYDEITPETDIKLMSFDGKLTAAWPFPKSSGSASIEGKFLEKLKSIPITAIEKPEKRAEAALTLLRDLLKDCGALLPSIAKLMLFELMRSALMRGSISSIEWSLLEEFKRHNELEDFLFKELLERAESTCRETQKTLALILE